MAEPMDQDTSTGRSLLEQDLSCPVCLELYRDPVLLTCSHSFCRQCLERSWKSNAKTCPLCKAVFEGEQPIPNRALNDTCESFRRDKEWQNRSNPSQQSICRMHGDVFQLYCMKDQEQLCPKCVTQHAYHEIVPLQVGLTYCKVNIRYYVMPELLYRPMYLFIYLFIRHLITGTT